MSRSTVAGTAGCAIAAWLVGPVSGQQVELDPASLMTTPIVLRNGSRNVSQGTGFFFASTTPDGKVDTVFLVTNYHVVTGHAPLSTEARTGDRIWFVMHQDPADLTKVRPIELALYDARRQPIWVASESHPAADIVLVPLPPRTYAGIVPLVFTEAHTRTDIKIRPTAGATLLGYPFGFYDQKHYLPIWKTGHVASEPNVDFEGRPAFLVDVSAFPGMSGSPVLAVANGVYETENGQLRSGRLWRLLGVFSKMPVAGERDTNLQLGYVWKATLIAELARSYRPK
ncbi:MAG TPA: serine protease [Vicinamibacterales bacterium]|jgi:hypothetical protein